MLYIIKFMVDKLIHLSLSLFLHFIISISFCDSP